MHVSTKISRGASFASAVPLPFPPSALLVATKNPRDTQSSDDNGVPVAGIVIGVVIGIVLIITILAYLFSHDNCITRRGWLKRRRERVRNNSQSQHLSPPDDEESLTKHASFTSDRESMMFSRSRASSLQLAVVEDMDESQRRMSSQVYVLRGDKYIPVEQVEAERKSLLNRNATEMTEVDIASVDNDETSHYSIPVVVSPPPEHMQAHGREGISRNGSIDRSDAVSEMSVYSEHASP